MNKIKCTSHANYCLKSSRLLLKNFIVYLIIQSNSYIFIFANFIILYYILLYYIILYYIILYYIILYYIILYYILYYKKNFYYNIIKFFFSSAQYKHDKSIARRAKTSSKG